MVMNNTLLSTSGDGDLVSLPFAAEKIIGIPRSSAYLLVLRGELAARMICGRYVVRRSDALEFKRSRARAARARAEQLKAEHALRPDPEAAR